MTANESAMTKENSFGEDSQSKDESQIFGDDDIKDFVKELDVEAISKEVFKIFDVKIGLDTKLSLRKV